MRRIPRTLASLTTTLALSLASLAYAADPTLDRAERLIAAQDAATAYAELAPLEAQRAGEPRFDYLLGLAALDAGHVTRAIFALERVVATRPDDQQARAELARAYLLAGESASARAELERVRRADVPAEAAASIDRVLGLLDQVAPSNRPSYAGYVEFGGGWDTNVNSATNAGQFAIPAFGGLLFDIAEDSTRRSDGFGTVAAGASAKVPLAPGWSLFGGLDGRGIWNADAHDMDNQVLAGTAGVSRVAGPHAQSVALQANNVWLSNSVYRTAVGGSAQWQMQLDAASQASVFGQWSRLGYSGQRERDADRAVLGIAYARQVQTIGTLVYGSVYGADESARDGAYDYHGHHGAGARLGGEKAFGDVLVFAEWQYERRRYGATEPLFDVRRADHQSDWSVGVRWAVTPHWQLVPQIRHTNAASNVVLYDYDRTVYQLTFRRDFR